jgi:hypothetical protein
MSENPELEAKAWSYTREKIGRLLRDMYNEPQEPSPRLCALIAKLIEGVPPPADEAYPQAEVNPTAPK